MAIKAGLVGVNPKGIDKNGMPIASGGSVDAYTKAESDSKYATISNTYTKTESDNRYYTKLAVNELLGSKVGVGQLEANNKSFHFAYDSTSEKYGYKLDGTGEFIPFEEAGAPGWNKPATLVDTGLVYTDATVSKVAGGYYDDNINKKVYIDIVLTTSANVSGSSSGSLITGLPHNASSKTNLLMNTSVDNNADVYIANFNSSGITCAVQTSGYKINKWSSGTFSANYYMHLWGMYEYTT